MSDLAHFVAATLRDKVVIDLQEENQKLCDESAIEVNKSRIRESLLDYSRVFQVAIVGVGPDPNDITQQPRIYATCIDGPRPNHRTDFITHNACTLGDIVNSLVHVFVNGVAMGRLKDSEPCLWLTISSTREGAPFASLDELFLVDGNYISFLLCMTDPKTKKEVSVWFDFLDVSKERLVEFHKENVQDILTNTPVDDRDHRCSFDELVEAFGSDTKVKFDHAVCNW